jgi:hypothetical protein
MDDRLYEFYRYYTNVLDFFKTPETALWATKLHAKKDGYTQAEIQAVLAEYERRKVDTSPMVHLTQHQLEVMVEAKASLKAFHYPMTLPAELKGAPDGELG